MRSTLLYGRGLAAAMSRYAAGVRQPMHRDGLSRISLLLRGSFREDGPRGSFEITAGCVLLKSRTVRHENAFGGDGALLLTIEFDDGDERLAQVGEDCWRQRSDKAAIRLGAALLEGAVAKDAGAVDAACADLLVEADEAAARRRAAPGWLLRLKHEVEAASLAQLDVAARAREAGVHPAHASRLFRRCFGASITEHAQAHGVRRAIALMSLPGARLADVALAAGFYDQSHMNRAFRRVSGRAPGAHRTLVDQVSACAC